MHHKHYSLQARIPAKRGRQPGSGRGSPGRGRGSRGGNRGIAYHPVGLHGIGELGIVMEKVSSHPGRGGVIKTEEPFVP